MIVSDRHPWWFLVLGWLALFSGCGQSQPSDSAQADGTTVDAAIADGAAQKAPPGEALGPAFDDEGIPIPHPRKLALGTPIPQGFERLHKNRGETVYKGPISVEKVYRFYRRYLECSQVREGSRGWQFKRATPRAPGDTTRLVDVTVLRRRQGKSQVVIVDRMGQVNTKTPPGKIKTQEQLFEEAHKGAGSVRNPIPGTY